MNTLTDTTMTTLRIFSNKKRVATGKPWKNLFLQVYPILKEFKSAEEWKQSWGQTSVEPRAAPAKKPTTRSSSKWAFTKEFSITAPAGEYYIGDLCYALHDHIYKKVFGDTAYSGGLYKKGHSFFLVDGTSCGDGTYSDDYDREYMVDAGIIGICSNDLINRESRSLRGGHIYIFKEPVECVFKDGLFSFESGTESFEIQT